MPKQLITLFLLVGAVLWLPSCKGQSEPMSMGDAATVTDLPAGGSFIVLDGDFDLSESEDLLLFDVDNHQLAIWDLQQADMETVLASNPIVVGDKVVGRNGRYQIPTPPDGRLLAISLASGQMAYASEDAKSIWAANLDGSGARQLAETAVAGDARWSTGGQTLLFEDRFEIRRVNDHGSDLETVAAFPGLWVSIADWSPDNNELALATWDWLYYFNIADQSYTWLMGASGRNPSRASGVEIWSPDSATLAILNRNNTRQSELLLWEKGAEMQLQLFETGVIAAAWSPDSQQLAVWGAGDCEGKFDLEQGHRNKCSFDLYIIDDDGRNLTRLTALKIDDRKELESIIWLNANN